MVVHRCSLSPVTGWPSALIPDASIFQSLNESEEGSFHPVFRFFPLIVLKSFWRATFSWSAAWLSLISWAMWLSISKLTPGFKYFSASGVNWHLKVSTGWRNEQCTNLVEHWCGNSTSGTNCRDFSFVRTGFRINYQWRGRCFCRRERSRCESVSWRCPSDWVANKN